LAYIGRGDVDGVGGLPPPYSYPAPLLLYTRRLLGRGGRRQDESILRCGPRPCRRLRKLGEEGADGLLDGLQSHTLHATEHGYQDRFLLRLRCIHPGC
jgi:hypothetical protein